MDNKPFTVTKMCVRTDADGVETEVKRVFDFDAELRHGALEIELLEVRDADGGTTKDYTEFEAVDAETEAREQIRVRFDRWAAAVDDVNKARREGR